VPTEQPSKETHFNELTPVEAELLAVFAEECAEAIQIVGKILRHGLRSYHPDSHEVNGYTLEREMGDVRAAMILLCEAGIARKATVHSLADSKLSRIDQYLHHAAVPASLKAKS
jgi:hypothetical protein